MNGHERNMNTRGAGRWTGEKDGHHEGARRGKRGGDGKEKEGVLREGGWARARHNINRLGAEHARESGWTP